MPVVLTRPDNRSLSALCEKEGWQVFDLPIFKRIPLPKPDMDLSAYEMVFLVNSYVAEQFYPYYAKGLPAGLALGAAGLSTAATLKRLGATQALWVAQKGQDSEHFWQYLQAQNLLPKLKKILIVRAQTGRDWLADRFKEQGIQVDYLSIYERQLAHWSDSQIQQLAMLNSEMGAVGVLTSASAIEPFCQKLWTHRLAHVFSNILITHERFEPILIKQYQAYGWKMPQIYRSTPQEQTIILTLRSILNTI